MQQDEKDIRELFQQMKATDLSETGIPSFDLPPSKRKKRRTTYYTWGGLAASLLLFVVFTYYSNPDTESTDEFTITVNMGSTNNTSSTSYLMEETSMTDWNAPSDILIKEFDD